MIKPIPLPTSETSPARGAARGRRRSQAAQRTERAGTAVITKTKTQTKSRTSTGCWLLNDDYTRWSSSSRAGAFFNKDREAATRIMLHVLIGIGECGIYTYEVAETKVTQVMDFARKHQHPLQCVMRRSDIRSSDDYMTQGRDDNRSGGTLDCRCNQQRRELMQRSHAASSNRFTGARTRQRAPHAIRHLEHLLLALVDDRMPPAPPSDAGCNVDPTSWRRNLVAYVESS